MKYVSIIKETFVALIIWGFIYIIAAFFIGWWPFNSNNDLLPFSKYEDVSVNAYFYFPDNREVFLGRYKGASACQSAASNYAYSKEMSSANWSYICCTIEKGSSCYRKIK